MLRLPYTWVDVFAEAPFQGNQLAVFTAPADLPDEAMFAITREMNHSETTFLQPPTLPGADLRVRICIPAPGGAAEIPFAGHPILGTAVVHAMAREALEASLHVETGGGLLIPVQVRRLDSHGWTARMSQPLPRLVRTIDAGPALAGALGLTPTDIRSDVPIEAVDNGMQTVLIPLASVAAVQRVQPDMAKLRALLGRDGFCTLLFALGGLAPESHVHCRVFSPWDQVGEDPATGSANGPLGEYLVRHGLVADPVVISEQGYAINRPSKLVIEVQRNGGVTSGVFVSGTVRLLGKGEFTIPGDR